MLYNKSKIIIIIIAVILTITALFYINQKYPEPTTINYQYQRKKFVKLEELPKPQIDNNLDSKILNPKSLNLLVPFTPQAPTANWDQLHNEACEEASAIMAAAYFSSSTYATLPAVEVEKEITKLTDWQQKTFGYNLSISSEETVQMVKEVYGLNAEVLENFTSDDIKKSLSQGKLILFPANGRKLGNPYYKQPGPPYHMLIIKGYDSKDNFITNDPGTKRGLNYPYNFDVLFRANGNYNHSSESVDLEDKNIIIVSKK